MRTNVMRLSAFAMAAALLVWGCGERRLKPVVQQKKNIIPEKTEIPDLREDFLRAKARKLKIEYSDAVAADVAISGKHNPLALRDPAVVLAGQRIFKEMCARCHGPDMHGFGEEGYSIRKMSLRRDDRVKRWRSSDGQWAKYFKTVAEGSRPFLQDPVPGFEKYLAREQIWQVVTYVRKVQLSRDE